MENDVWIEWVWSEQKPYPDVSGDVYIRNNYGWESRNSVNVRGWKWDEDFDGSIVTHYKLAKGS